ncbi:MAG TPA: tetratricopeptide repeat protein [Candidatus Limnocylindria bacterium]|nr:tetratricopeptide repeat protein [Candidatus Limnocylindria bacterium]
MKRLIATHLLLGILLAVAWPAAVRGDAATTALLEAVDAPIKAAHSPNDYTGGVADAALRETADALATTNLLSKKTSSTGQSAQELAGWREKIEVARRLRLQRLYAEATPTLIAAVLTNTPDEIKRTALLELAIIAQEENHLSRAQQIFAQYLTKWPDDPTTPEVLLRQGLILRQIGLNNAALTKFYAVMTSSLVLKAEKLEYYQRLVLQAQTEIADTYFQQGKFRESADFFSRLLKLDSPLLNKPQVHFKLVRSLSALGRHEEVTFQAYNFLGRHSDAVEQPEVRFYLATALKALGRNNDSLQQVLLLLLAQKDQRRAHPETWAYWQQRTGNEIANQLYKEGDYLRALEIYSGLAALNTNVSWQLPVWYQIGLTFERLQQPAKALGQYEQVARREPEIGTNASPTLRTVLDMARWRQQYLGWQTNLETLARPMRSARVTTEPNSQP